jgi:hypothetical protein
MQEDAGVRVVRAVHRLLNVDDEWSVWEGRGFIWWGGPLAQHVWADPPFTEEGFVVSRVHVRTDLLAGFQGSESQFAKLGAVMGYSTLSGPIRDPSDSSRLQLAASLYVHDETAGWLERLAGLAAAIQAAEAHIWGMELPELLDGASAKSQHPQSGFRDDLDDMLNVIEKVIPPASGQDSAYHGEEMLAAVEMLQRPPCVLATGGEGGCTAEFPFGSFTSRLQLFTDQPHPRLGNGLLTLLTMPSRPAADAAHGAAAALGLNELELQSLTRCHFLGSWCHDEEGLTFTSFYPNFLVGCARGCTQAFIRSSAVRAQWVTENVFKQPWDYEAACEGKERQLKLLAGLLAADKAKPKKGKKKRRRDS